MIVDLQIHMDYGHFYLRGRRDFEWDGWLVEQANAAPPSAYTPDGDALVVLSPHQWNLTMPMSVEVLDGRPASDSDDWQQVSECRLTVDTPGVLQIDSPVSSYATCDVPPGRYVAQVSGRGFFANPYQHEAAEMADVWRTRLWPDHGGALEPPKIFPARCRHDTDCWRFASKHRLQFLHLICKICSLPVGTPSSKECRQGPKRGMPAWRRFSSLVAKTSGCVQGE